MLLHLPNELLQAIVQACDEEMTLFDRHIPEGVVCSLTNEEVSSISLVCKRLRRVTLPIWTREIYVGVDLFNITRAEMLERIGRLVRRVSANPKLASMCRMLSLSILFEYPKEGEPPVEVPSSLFDIFKGFPAITCLDLWQSEFSLADSFLCKAVKACPSSLTRLIIDTEVFLDTDVDALVSLPSSMKTIEIDTISVLEPRAWDAFSQRELSVRSVHITTSTEASLINWSGITFHGVDHMEVDGAENVAFMAQHISSLLDRHPTLHSIAFTHGIDGPIPHLMNQHWENYPFIPNAFISALNMHTSRMEVMALSRESSKATVRLDGISITLRSLEGLGPTAASVAEHCPTLKILSLCSDVGFCESACQQLHENITPARFPRIEQLTLYWNSPNVSSRDSVNSLLKPLCMKLAKELPSLAMIITCVYASELGVERHLDEYLVTRDSQSRKTGVEFTEDVSDAIFDHF